MHNVAGPRCLNAGAGPLPRSSPTNTDQICAAPLANCMWPEAKGASIGRRGQACGGIPIATMTARHHLTPAGPTQRRSALALRSWAMVPWSPHGLAL